MHFLLYPDGRKLRLAIWGHAAAGGAVVVGDDGVLRFIEDELPPCNRPNFTESVAGSSYTDAQKHALTVLQQSEAAAWDAAHPEYVAWAARQPRVVHEHLNADGTPRTSKTPNVGMSGLPYAAELARLRIDAARLRVAATQASFCLRTLAPDAADAQMTVRMLHEALGRA